MNRPSLRRSGCVRPPGEESGGRPSRRRGGELVSELFAQDLAGFDEAFLVFGPLQGVPQGFELFLEPGHLSIGHLLEHIVARCNLKMGSQAFGPLAVVIGQ